MYTCCVVELIHNDILYRASNGTELMCCSCDGTVAYIKFKQEEIGSPMSKSDVVIKFGLISFKYMTFQNVKIILCNDNY